RSQPSNSICSLRWSGRPETSSAASYSRSTCLDVTSRHLIAASTRTSTTSAANWVHSTTEPTGSKAFVALAISTFRPTAHKEDGKQNAIAIPQDLRLVLVHPHYRRRCDRCLRLLQLASPRRASRGSDIHDLQHRTAEPETSPHHAQPEYRRRGRRH